MAGIMKKALITGITGQDGSYMAEFLLKNGYKVFGLNRRTSTVTTGRIKHLIDKIELVTKGRVRRSKLYYLRNLRGKAARIKEKRFA